LIISPTIPATTIKYAYWDGSEWQIQTVDSEGYVGPYTSIVLNIGDAPHISYYDESNGALKYASPQLYKLRNKIERFINRMKQFRRIATRYEKLAETYLAFIHIVSVYVMLS
jgi:hypothetical protein